MTKAYLALGSNLGDRDEALAFAVRSLEDEEGIAVLECSAVYETDPVGPGDQAPYLNAVVSLDTLLTGRQLLERAQSIEQRAGREPSAERLRWGARTLDIDLLFFGAERFDESDLVVPHPRIAERSFVLVPLADLAPDLVHPVLGRTPGEMLEELREGPGARPLPPGVRLWERCLRIGERPE